MTKRKPVGGRLRRKKRLRKKGLTAAFRAIVTITEMFDKRVGLAELMREGDKIQHVADAVSHGSLEMEQLLGRMARWLP